MVADAVLRFVAQTVAEGQVGARLIVVLKEKSCVEEIDTRTGSSGCHVVLGWRVCRISGERGVDIVSIKTRRRVIGISRKAQARAEVQRMSSFRRGHVVLEFITVLIVADHAVIVSSTGEGSLHGDCGIAALRNLVVTIARVLKTGLIDQVGAQHLRIAHLDRVLIIERVVSLAFQRRLRNTVVGLLLSIEHVADAERVALAELEVETRADVEARLRVCNGRRVVV